VSVDPYVYPGTSVLKNRFGLTDAADPDRIERLHTANCMLEAVPRGSFDLAHLRAIHRHLFQDVYDWAGELRTVEISKGRQQFRFRQYIQTGMADVHCRLVGTRFLHDLATAAFAEQAAVIIGDINYIHPFREGNGRTNCSTRSSLPPRRDTPSIWPGSTVRAGLPPRCEAMRRTTSGWSKSSPRP
jgi:cell filamentation protein